MSNCFLIMLIFYSYSSIEMKNKIAHSFIVTNCFHSVIYWMLFAVILSSILRTSSGAVLDFTCFNFRPIVADEENTFLGGYKSGNDTHAVVTFERTQATGSGIDLPTMGEVDKHSSASALLFQMPANIGAKRFGVYDCVFTRQQDVVRITTTVMRKDGDVSPASSTLTTSAGEDVTLTMTQLYNESPTALRWRHDGVDVTAWNGQSSISIHNVQVSHAGIYECFIDGRYNLQNHALMKLIVRACSQDSWGSSCDNRCPMCYNGGVCHDKTGECICAPGFSGIKCQTLHGQNCFGQDCSITCSVTSVGCRGAMMCPLDPFGCTCAAGYTGRRCAEDCQDGYFGANCELRCHCGNGTVCDKGHGKCPNDVQCASGYTGENCQECPDGLFGATCTKECHCEGGEVCDKVTGKCPDGVICEQGYRGVNCQNSCPYGMIGLQPNCSDCHVPVKVRNMSISGPANRRRVNWGAPQNKCPVIDYGVKFQLVMRDHCQMVNGVYETVLNTSATELSTLDVVPYLHAFSIYNVRVFARNEAGYSKPVDGSQSFTTLYKEPSVPPPGFNLTSIGRHRLAFAWSEIPCGKRNGYITGYRILFRATEKPYNVSFKPCNAYTSVNISRPRMQQNITDLEPSTKYEILLAGVNDAGPGKEAKVDVFTAVETALDAPSKPTSASSRTTPSSVTIALQLPISSPYITGIQIGVRRMQPIMTTETTNSRHLRSSNVTLTNEHIAAELRKEGLPETFTVGDGKSYGGYYNKPLKSNTTYAIYLGSVSRTSDEDFFVVWGEPLRIKVPGGIWVQGYSTQKPFAVPEGSFPLVPVLLPSLVLFVIGCVATAIVYRRKKVGVHHRKPDTSSHIKRDIDTEEEETSFSAVGHSPPKRPTESKPQQARLKQTQLQGVALTEFDEYVSRKKAESYGDGNGFLSDYESLPVGPLHLISIGKHEQNKEKNRYINILPYDYSRVVLEQLPDDPCSDYINASYMDGFNESNAYIACQGPTTASVDDMWRMVWQQNTATIVMLTNLHEGNKIKCEKYWPDKTSVFTVYGSIIVKGNKEEKHAHYVIRDFIIALKSQERCSRKVRQYHFSTWPDMGLPDDPSVVVNFIKLIKEYNPKNAGPMIIHCSAGIGRTGVFIVLHSMFEKAKIEGRVDIWNFVCAMRDRRLHMIQTAVQYEFLFDVLYETFLSGDTAIQEDIFVAELAALKKVTKSTGKSGLQQQMEKLSLVTKPPNHDVCQAGQNPENAHKNRYPDKMPVDRFRPRLMSGGSEDSTDYINASFLNSYSCNGMYVVTQMPLPHTVHDMWRMVHDYNTTCIVMLNPKHDMDQSCGKYWPDEDSPTMKSGSYTITLQQTDRIDEYIIGRYMTLVTYGKQEPRLICHLQLLDWPNEGVPPSCRSVLKLVKAVQKWKQKHGNHRVAVHCIDGEGASGTFCALLNIMERLEDEKVVDVFQAVKKIRVTCHRSVRSLVQYTFLYEAVKTFLNQDVVYENLL